MTMAESDRVFISGCFMQFLNKIERIARINFIGLLQEIKMPSRKKNIVSMKLKNFHKCKTHIEEFLLQMECLKM